MLFFRLYLSFDNIAALPAVTVMPALVGKHGCYVLFGIVLSGRAGRYGILFSCSLLRKLETSCGPSCLFLFLLQSMLANDVPLTGSKLSVYM
jgi:hypothetical protein